MFPKKWWIHVRINSFVTYFVLCKHIILSPPSAIGLRVEFSPGKARTYWGSSPRTTRFLNIHRMELFTVKKCEYDLLFSSLGLQGLVRCLF